MRPAGQVEIFGQPQRLVAVEDLLATSLETEGSRHEERPTVELAGLELTAAQNLLMPRIDAP
jgi:hypothetical protein